MLDNTTWSWKIFETDNEAMVRNPRATDPNVF